MVDRGDARPSDPSNGGIGGTGERDRHLADAIPGVGAEPTTTRDRSRAMPNQHSSDDEEAAIDAAENYHGVGDPA